MLNHALLALTAVLSGIGQTSPTAPRDEVDRPPLLDPATLPADERVTGPSDQSERAIGARASGYTLDTPIATLVANPAAKAVLDRDLPGLSADANLAKFEAMSLRQFQPLTGGQLDEVLLAKVGSDLAALASGSSAAAKPAPVEGR